MKKFLTLLLTTAIAFLSLSACTTIAKVLNPLKLNDTIKCTDATIKTSTQSYVITPAGFDFEELNNRGYKMSIKITYDVYYTKAWNVLGDIGYLGAPKYEVCILDDDLVGNMEANVTAPSTSKTKTITYTTNIVNLIGSKVFLTFSSDNIQNEIHFENISVAYNCYK